MAPVSTDPLRGLAALTENEMSLHLAAAVLADRFLYCPALGWMEWDGQLWHRHEDREAIAVKRAIRYYIADWVAAEFARLNIQQVIAMYGFLKSTGLEKLEKMVKTVNGVTVPVDAFDADPMLLNTPGGVVDLRDGSVQPHDPALRITRVTGASYVPGATHPDWDQALLALPDDETRLWLQCYLGRGCMGSQGRVEVVPFLRGGGHNGKSIVVTSVMNALGSYAGLVSDTVLAGTAHSEAIMTLRGLRLAVIEELADGHRVNIARLKQMIGTEAMRGRHLYRSEVEWKPTHTLAVTTNYQPIIVETDFGSWRRVVQIPFPHRWPKDNGFKDRCYDGSDQQAAVLAWLVAGAAMAVPEPSEAMVEATSEWRMSVDLVAQFLDERCVRDPGGQVPRGVLLDAFNEFAVAHGSYRLSGRMFTERFREHPVAQDWGIGEVRTADARFWRGLSVRADPLNRRAGAVR
jgi:P4 family phage/plasmid primase-like protien